MKKTFLAFLLIFCVQCVYVAQIVSKADSIEILKTADKTFELV